MSNKNNEQEDLIKLEEKAYFELCQIIAEGMQSQNVDLLDIRIAEWKKKYKKLIDGTSPNSKFKKKIEFLLNQYYSSVTQYILQQLKIKEYVKIQNQSKALKNLYSIIKETNDLKTLKQKVKKWESKYPVYSFLKMYQKRITSYTREKNLEENAFDQNKAFSELVDITKTNSTLDELKYKLSKWEENYSINKKFEIDDFIKNQNEVKKYTSDEYLTSIARDYVLEENQNNNVIKEKENSLDNQAKAYNSLLEIVKKPNNANKVFEWVYKNRNLEFNDNYKELILSATYIDYSLSYLNNIEPIKINLSNHLISFDEYNNMYELKRYAAISYFNLLLPTENKISNKSFNEQEKETFFETVHEHSIQANLIEKIDETVNEYSEKKYDENTINLNIQKTISG